MLVKINDLNVNYEVSGSGKPVILLHGWLCSLETMKPIEENLKNHFTVYNVDIVGFGKSDMPKKALNSNDFGDFLAEFVNTLKIENPILIGHSNGGRTIINAVGRDIVKPNKIILIDSAGLKPKRSTKYYIKVGIAKTGKFILNLIPGSIGKKLKEKAYSKVGSEDYKNSNSILKETMKNILNEDQTDMLSKINVPTLLFWGSLDNATPIEDGRKMEKLIPNAGLVEYQNSTHFSFLENLSNFNIVVNEFLKEDM